MNEKGILIIGGTAETVQKIQDQNYACNISHVQTLRQAEKEYVLFKGDIVIIDENALKTAGGDKKIHQYIANLKQTETPAIYYGTSNWSEQATKYGFDDGASKYSNINDLFLAVEKYLEDNIEEKMSKQEILFIGNTADQEAATNHFGDYQLTFAKDYAQANEILENPSNFAVIVTDIFKHDVSNGTTIADNGISPDDNKTKNWIKELKNSGNNTPVILYSKLAHMSEFKEKSGADVYSQYNAKALSDAIKDVVQPKTQVGGGSVSKTAIESPVSSSMAI